MRPYVCFGRAGFDLSEFWGWCDDPEAGQVEVFAKSSGRMILQGLEHDRFMRFIGLRMVEAEAVPVLFGTNISGDEPGRQATMSSQ